MNALKIYRLSNWLYKNKMRFFAKFLGVLNVWLYSCKIPYKLHIGKNTKFAGGGFCLNLNAGSIGENCTIGGNCTMMRKFPYKELPNIGNNVYISHGVRFIGPVKIGSNSIISANCVVTKSVPDNSIVAGVPGKIIGTVDDLSYDISKLTSDKEGWMPFLEKK